MHVVPTWKIWNLKLSWSRGTFKQKVRTFIKVSAWKETLKFRLKPREDFWIQKLETLTSKGLYQELNNVQIPVNCISCSLFSIFDFSLELKRFYQVTWQRKPDVKFWSFCKLASIHKIPLKTVERSKQVGKTDFLLTFFPVLIVRFIYI